MRELLTGVERWRSAGQSVAVARLVDLEGSGPRLPGAAMAVSDSGEVLGSVTGGCVEGAVVEEARDVLVTGRARLVTFGYSDDDAFAVGLTCGGTVHLFLERLDPPPATSWFEPLAAAIRAHRPAVLVSVVSGPGAGDRLLLLDGEQPDGHLADPDLERVVVRDAEAALATGTTSVRHYGEHGEANEEAITVSFDVHAPPPQMLIFGAVDFTGALSRVAKVLGYHVTVCDAREVFATTARFPFADEVVVDWPHRLLDRVGTQLGPRDAVCVLTHDAKFDVPAIRAALATRVGYVGAMGSRRTTEDRAARLREEGVEPEALARLMAPIGLDLGARTPEETAVAICAEIIAHHTGRPAPSLKHAAGPIHRT